MVVARRNKPWKARWNLTPNPKTPFSFPVSTPLPSYINSFFKGEGQKRRRRHTHSYQLFFALTQQAPTTTSTTEQYSHGFRLRHSQRTFRASEAPISLPTWPSSLPSGISLPTLLFLILSSFYSSFPYRFHGRLLSPLFLYWNFVEQIIFNEVTSVLGLCRLDLLMCWGLRQLIWIDHVFICYSLLDNHWKCWLFGILFSSIRLFYFCQLFSLGC